MRCCRIRRTLDQLDPFVRPQGIDECATSDRAGNGRGTGGDAPTSLGEDPGKERWWRCRDHVGLLMERLVEAHALLGAAEAGMPDAHRPGIGPNIAELDGRAVGIGLGSLATEFVETPALAVTFVAELLGEAGGIEMRPAFAVVVDQASIGEERPALAVKVRQLLKRQIIEDRREQVVGRGRTSQAG